MIELWQGTSQGSQGSQELREELGAGGERVELPPCKFWPPAEETAVPVVASIVGTHQPVAFWNEDLGLHPLSPLWNGVSKMMIRTGVFDWIRVELNTIEWSSKVCSFFGISKRKFS